MSYLIYRLHICAYPGSCRNVMRDNMLISCKGHQGHYMGVDLEMEHIVNYQKVRTIVIESRG